MRPPAKHFGALAQPLDEILGATSRVRVLRSLERSSVPLATVTLARETGLAYNGVAKALAVLTPSGIITETPIGGMTAYALSPVHPFRAALSQLFAAERERRRAIPTAIEEWTAHRHVELRAVWLFGSVARHDDTFRSDVDIALVAEGRVHAHRYADVLRGVLAPVAERQRLYPNVVSYDAGELIALPHADAEMWNNLTRDAVALYGPDPSALRASLERQAYKRE